MFNPHLSFGLSDQPSAFLTGKTDTSSSTGTGNTVDPRLFASSSTSRQFGPISGTTTPIADYPHNVRAGAGVGAGQGPTMWAGPQEATLAQSTPVISSTPIPLDAAPLQEVLRARHERWSRHGGAMELPMATFSEPTAYQPLPQQPRTQSYQPASHASQPPVAPERRGRSTSMNTYDAPYNPGALQPQQPRASSTSRRSPAADDITVSRSPAIQVSQMSEVELLVAMSRTTLMSGYFTRPIDPPEWMRVLFPDEDDLQCFHHCIVYSMSIFVVKEDRNPWIEHVVPLIIFPTEFAPQSTQAMRLAMLATGATHLAYLEARKAAGSPEALRKRRLALRYRTDSVTLLREARHSPIELTSDAFLAATAIMLSNDMLAANSTWREIARLSRYAIHARGGCEQMIKGMTVKNSGQLAVLCVLSQLLVLDLYAVLSSGEPPHLYHGEEWWFQHDGEAPTMFDALLGMSSTTVTMAAQALIIWQDSFLLQARFGEEETSRLAFPPESHFVVTQPTPGALDFRITLPRHTPNLTRTYGEPGAPPELEDLARRTRQFLERNEQWHTSDWTNTLEERTQWGSLALYIGQHIMVRRDMYRLPREDKGCQILADVLLRMCLTVGDKMQFFKWPLIIAASVFTDEPRREATRQTLKAFEYQCCYDIAVAQAVIEESWRRADIGMDDDTCHWKRCFLELGCPVLLY